MNLENLIDKMDAHAKCALEHALSCVVNYNQASAEIEHWLYHLVKQHDAVFLSLLEKLSIPVAALVKSLLQSIESFPIDPTPSPVLGRKLVDLLTNTWQLASFEYNVNCYSAGFVLYALLSDTILMQYTYQCAPCLKKVDLKQLAYMLKDPRYQSDKSDAKPEAQEALNQYCSDLVSYAALGKIDHVVGREAELRQMIDILLRRRQNNPILTGDPGVGKTAIVEGLALRIAEKNVPTSLLSVRIYALDLGLLQAGAGVKGEFERRLKMLIQEIEFSTHPIILFIDEAHTLIGAGAQPGQTDAANLLKPALARGQLRVIAATTWSEYKKYIETDAALTRRFQVVNVKEPSEATASAILYSQVEKLEQHHGVTILSEAVDAAVRFSNRFLSERKLPDSALSVLDTACARVADEQGSMPVCVAHLQEKLATLQLERDRLSLEDASPLKKDQIKTIDHSITIITEDLNQKMNRYQSEKALIDQIKTGKKTADSKSKLTQLKNKLMKLQQIERYMHLYVDQDIIAHVISNWTGIPKQNMLRAPMQHLLTLKERLSKKILGQQQSVCQLVDKLISAHAKLESTHNPTAVFLLVGPSGVGKTQTAYTLAEEIFGDRSKMTVINMSEFKEAHKISTLTGAPPGYVGYGEGGVLTEAIRRDPYSLILLDEMEKAHSSVQEVFFQLFDQGQLRDSQGRDVNCSNSLIIMTCNSASRYIEQFVETGGCDIDDKKFTAGLHEVLCDSFSPAFLGRVTVVPYLPLSDDNLKQLIAKELALIVHRAHENYAINLHFDSRVTESILANCQQARLGARQIHQSMSKHLLPYVSTELLQRVSAHPASKSLHITFAENAWASS